MPEQVLKGADSVPGTPLLGAERTPAEAQITSTENKRTNEHPRKVAIQLQHAEELSS